VVRGARGQGRGRAKARQQDRCGGQGQVVELLAHRLTQNRRGHTKAAAAHQKAAAATNKAGRSKTAEYHNKMASYHLGRANRFSKAATADDLRKATETTPEDHDALEKAAGLLGDLHLAAQGNLIKCAAGMAKVAGMDDDYGDDGDDKGDDAKKSAESDDLRKSFTAASGELETLRKSHSTLTAEHEELKKSADEASALITDLLAKRKGSVRAIDKKDDTGTNETQAEDLTKRAPSTVAEAIEQARELTARQMRGEI